MPFSKGISWLLVLFCLGWSNPSFAQQASPPVSLAASRPLLNAADTVAALQDLFQTKRQSSGLFLAATPVAFSLTLVAVGASALGQLSGNSPSAVLPVIVLAAGTSGTVSVLSRYTRYTKGNERAVLSKYERTHVLPKWVARNLAQHRTAKP